jgi:hypothetical protein
MTYGMKYLSRPDLLCYPARMNGKRAIPEGATKVNIRHVLRSVQSDFIPARVTSDR